MISTQFLDIRAECGLLLTRFDECKVNTTEWAVVDAASLLLPLAPPKPARI